MFVLILITFILLYILQLSLAYYAAQSMEIPNWVKGIFVIPAIGLLLMVVGIVAFLISQIFKE